MTGTMSSLNRMMMFGIWLAVFIFVVIIGEGAVKIIGMIGIVVVAVIAGVMINRSATQGDGAQGFDDDAFYDDDDDVIDFADDTLDYAE